MARGATFSSQVPLAPSLAAWNAGDQSLSGTTPSARVRQNPKFRSREQTWEERALGPRPAPTTGSPSHSPSPLQLEARRRSRPGVLPTVQEPEVACAIPATSTLAMGLGPRLLLPLLLCLGLSALVSSGSSGNRKRGPLVTAKVTERRAATSPPVGWGMVMLWILGLLCRPGGGGFQGTGILEVAVR
ncbi:Hypothetical predicted protein [Marmota monax]|uniref:Uncharacterized protein n=1 Tax=Marmota monax TaxID=9995 RepID=A0A5E4C9F5_MARMO|nr:Hypothetical predicted protein [Marmota monax]